MIRALTEIHKKWDEYNDMKHEDIRRRLVAEGIIQNIETPSKCTISKWKTWVKTLESEGLWVPLRIRDVKGFIETIGEPEAAGTPEHAKAKAIIMTLFLKLLRGEFNGNTYYAPVRGILGADLMNITIKTLRQSVEHIRLTMMDSLVLDGIIRRTDCAPSIIMIPTPEQMIAKEIISVQELRRTSSI